MRVASEVILKLSIEQQLGGPAWPHPWDHYPFATAGKYVWLRYQDLDAGQREQIRRAMEDVRQCLDRNSPAAKTQSQ